MKKAIFTLFAMVFAVAMMAQVDVTFNVNMADAVDFDPATDMIYITGDILGWAEPGTDPDNQTMTDVDGDMIYSVTLPIAVGPIEYKYFMNAGWDGGEWGGGDNRMVEVAAAMTIDDVWAIVAGVENHVIADINIYPNPVQNFLTVENLDSVKEMAIYNIAGQKVIEMNVLGSSVTVDMRDFTSGVYFAVFTNEQNLQGTIKLIRE